MTEQQNPIAIDTLLHITDIHFWEIVRDPRRLCNKRFLGNLNVALRRRHELRTERAAEFTNYLAGLGVKSLLASGDFTSTATEGEYRRAQDFVDGLSQAGLDVTAMPGNHDVYTFEAVRKGRFETYFADYAPREGYPARGTLPGGTPLILVPTVCPNVLSSAGRIEAEAVARTAELVEACPPGPVLVAGHYPLLHETYAYRSSPGRRLRGAEALLALLREADRPILYLAGHVHRFSFVQDPVSDALQHLTTGALFLQRQSGQRGALSEIHVSAHESSVFEHVYTDAWRRMPASPSEQRAYRRK